MIELRRTTVVQKKSNFNSLFVTDRLLLIRYPFPCSTGGLGKSIIERYKIYLLSFMLLAPELPPEQKENGLLIQQHKTRRLGAKAIHQYQSIDLISTILYCSHIDFSVRDPWEVESKRVSVSVFVRLFLFRL